ncbi:MAG: EFR1 family ferrodoxin [Spirochaetales bacterium]|nr:EFR1 family ferrodoxin [Spirochaetales bacterium]
MKGIILYYSNTGNTLLACNYMAYKMKQVEFEFCNIKKQKKINLDQYEITGFATFTDAWEPPKLFVDFIIQLPEQKWKPAFVFNTFGFLSGKTLKSMAHHVTGRGFTVIGGHSLHTPENYPPMIRAGLDGAGSPNKGELKKFDEFISNLGDKIDAIKNKKEIMPGKVKIGIINTLLPTYPRSFIQPLMGEKKVDAELCTECGICRKECPTGAITLDPKPVFDTTKCHYCWACYNRCLQKAVYTTKFRGKYHYPRPGERMKEKLSVL